MDKKKKQAAVFNKILDKVASQCISKGIAFILTLWQTYHEVKGTP